MKKAVCLLLALVLILSLSACGGSKQEENTDPDFVWTREGYFKDGIGNYLSVSPSEDAENPGWYVGCIMDGETYGWLIPQEGNALHGNIDADSLENGEFIVTITEEGEDGLLLTLENGDAFHFFPMELEEADVRIRINTEGLGQIAYAKIGEELPFDDEYPAQSAQLNLAGPETYVLGAKADEGWAFVKWTKDGVDFSTDEQVTVQFVEDAEYIAVFEAQ